MWPNPGYHIVIHEPLLDPVRPVNRSRMDKARGLWFWHRKIHGLGTVLCKLMHRPFKHLCSLSFITGLLTTIFLCALSAMGLVTQGRRLQTTIFNPCKEMEIALTLLPRRSPLRYKLPLLISHWSVPTGWSRRMCNLKAARIARIATRIATSKCMMTVIKRWTRVFQFVIQFNHCNQLSIIFSLKNSS